ncbi:transporter [Desulfopila sp. IMCC35008]|uniref:transporter n=1 Tax=Desulfopila sp. IMCC35008 TaxID=2653858 RepID=UPI0027150651|nr:transporter [Desulfopila sp. IMCC35008]
MQGNYNIFMSILSRVTAATVKYILRFGKWFTLWFITIGLPLPCFALDPEPRNWNHLPMDRNFGGFAFAHTEAHIFFDPILLLKDFDLKLDTWAVKYLRTFELFQKSSQIDIIHGYQEGKWTGLLNGVHASTSRSGWSDTFVRVAMNLYGAPPLRGKEFGAYRSQMNIETIEGVALKVRLPTGNYLEDKLLNLGQNRFAFRPQLGVMHTWGKWASISAGYMTMAAKTVSMEQIRTTQNKISAGNSAMHIRLVAL